MFGKIDIYIIKRFLATFAFSLGLFSIIVIVFDVSEKLDDFMEKTVPLHEIIFGYYMNFLPFVMNLLGPAFVFIAVVFFTSKLADRSEIVAILASGTTFNRLLRPYMVTAVFLGILSYLMYAWILPEADKERVKFEDTYIRNLKNDFRTDIHRQIRPGIFLSMESFRFHDSTGGKTTLERFEGKELQSKLFAERIYFNHDANKWTLENYVIRDFTSGKGETLTKGDKLDTIIPFNPKDFFRRTDDIQSFNMNELTNYIDQKRLEGAENIMFYVTEKQRRYAAPFAIPILVLIAFCVASRKSRGGLGVHLATGIVFMVLYLFLSRVFITYGTTGVMNPIVAVWSPNVIFGLVAIILYRNTPK